MTAPPIIPMGPFLRTALASPAFKATAWMSRGFHFVGLLSPPLLVQTAGALAGRLARGCLTLGKKRRRSVTRKSRKLPAAGIVAGTGASSTSIDVV
jgi:hypothetical protein